MVKPSKPKEKLYMERVYCKDEVVWPYYAKSSRNPGQPVKMGKLFCLITEASIPEEPGAVVPHAGIWCATKGTKVMEEGPPVGAIQVDPPNNPMLLRLKALVVSN